jgi:type I restriction enzyme, S subunit
MVSETKFITTEIGVLPEDWKVMDIKSIADRNQEHSFIDGDWIEAKYIEDNGIRLIQTGNIGIGHFIEKESKKYISEKTFHELNCKEVKPGDILICRLAAPIGRACIAPDLGTKAITAVDVVILKVNEKEYSREYINYYLNFEKTLQRMESFASGSTRQRISRTNLGNVLIAIPPLYEQRKIAAILSSVDEAIEKTEAIIEQTEKVKKGLMQQLLTKGIGHTKFKKTEIGEIPEEWEVKQLAEVCVVNPTYRIEKGTICSYVEMGAVNENSPHISYFGKREAGQGGGSRFKENDVLFARITPCTENGKTALVPKLESEVGLGSTEFIVLSPLKQILDPKFLYYLVKSDRVRNYAISRMTGTTGRQRVPKEVFEQELMIALPPIDEQKKIGEILYNYDKKIDHEKRWKNQLQTIKKGLMQVLLTGKVRVKVDDEVMSQ